MVTDSLGVCGLRIYGAFLLPDHLRGGFARGDVGEPVPVEELQGPVADHAHRQPDGGPAVEDLADAGADRKLVDPRGPLARLSALRSAEGPGPHVPASRATGGCTIAVAWKLMVAGGIGATNDRIPPRRTGTGTVTATRPLIATCLAFQLSGATATYSRRLAAL